MNKKNIMHIIFVCFLLLAFTASVLAIPDCSPGTPDYPYTLIGTATYSGTALASKTVTATIDGNSDSATTDSSGNYQLVVTRCGNSSTTSISFTVCTRAAAQTGSYVSGGDDRLDLTISSACPVTASTGGGSGGAGGGGGGGTVAEEEVTAEATESQTWDVVEEDQETTMEIDNELIPVLEFSFVTDKDITSVEITVSSYTEKPSSFKAIPLSVSSLIYKYIKITPKNIGEENLKKSSIEFKVPLSWLDENNAVPEDIIFLKFKDGKWVELSVGFISKDSVNAYFNVENPGFGQFSIGLKPKAAAEPVEEAEEEEAEEIEISEEVKQKEKLIGWAIASVIIIIGIITYFWFTRKKK